MEQDQNREAIAPIMNESEANDEDDLAGDGVCKSARGVEPVTEFKTGLTEVEVVQFQEEFGLNELAKDETKWYIQLLSKFWGTMPIIIWIAIIVEGCIRDWPSFGVLWALQLINGGLGFIEERKAGNALKELEGQLASVEEKFEKYFGYLARCEGKFCTTTLKTSKNHAKINQNA